MWLENYTLTWGLAPLLEQIVYEHNKLIPADFIFKN